MVVLIKADEVYVESVYQFVEDFEMHDEFEEKYGVPIDDWENEKSDDEVIGELLDESDDIYTYRYEELVDGFYINRIREEEIKRVISE